VEIEEVKSLREQCRSGFLFGCGKGAAVVDWHSKEEINNLRPPKREIAKTFPL